MSITESNSERDIIKQTQLKVLKYIISKSNKTEFGKKFHFNTLLLNPDLPKAFNKLIPIYSYESYYKEWITKMLNDNPNISWKGKIKYYAVSSGTSEGTSKYLPISKAFIKSCKKLTRKIFISIIRKNYRLSLTRYSVLTIGGSICLTKENNHYYGDLSGIFALNKPLWTNLITRPNNKINNNSNWNERINEIVKHAHKWNIKIIVGNIAWTQYIIEKIVKHYRLNHIHEIWPKLSTIISGGIFIENYLPSLTPLLGKNINYLNSYVASEGIIGIQYERNLNQFRFNYEYGIYYELIEYNSKNFDLAGNLKENPIAITITDAKVNKNYSLLLTTNSGLWRYHIGDVIKIVDQKHYIFEIIGRTKQYLSDIGEHLSIEEINKTINRICLIYKINIVEFTVLSKTIHNNYSHHWYISINTNDKISEKEISESIDQELISLNDDYASLRKNLIQKVEVSIIPKELFYNWLDIKGKLNGQAKIPRVMKGVTKESWLEFIK